MRLAFMGTPEFATYTLQALIDAGHDIAVVYTQPPAPAGRGKKLKKSPVHSLAEQQGLTVETPKSMRAETVINGFRSLQLDMAVIVAYGQILPTAILSAPTHGCVNVHASLLPRWRGAAPIHRAIMAGDAETGVDIMLMEEGLDTGPLLAREKTVISASDTTQSLHDRLAKAGAKLIDPTIRAYAAGTIAPTPQALGGVTYAHKITKQEARLDWSLSALEIDQQVRGLFPFPGAWMSIGGERIKVLSGSVIDHSGAAGPAGTVLDDNLTIACGQKGANQGAYQIDRAQRAGKGAMDRQEFLRGFPVPKGTKLEGTKPDQE